MSGRREIKFTGLLIILAMLGYMFAITASTQPSKKSKEKYSSYQQVKQDTVATKNEKPPSAKYVTRYSRKANRLDK